MNRELKNNIDKLNDEQRAVALHKDGPLLVIAGAGAGKTHTLITRVAYLIDQGVKPEQILLLTFTNKAADEMKERATKMVDGADEIVACTYHSFCVKMLRKFGRAIGIFPNFSILSTNDVITALNLVKAKAGDKYSVENFTPSGKIAELISKARNKEKPLSTYCNADNGVYQPKLVKELAHEYYRYKLENNMLDFDDLLYRFYKLISEREDVRDVISNHFTYMMVDEYQDTNTLQEKIILKLREKNDNIVVVGDDSQSIYGFRGAEIANILNFDKKFNNCKRVTVDKNYRSGQSILDIANNMMLEATEGFKKVMKAQRPIEVTKSVVRPANQYEEAEYALSIIDHLHTNGVPYKDIAVLERHSYSSNMLESMLTVNGIGYDKYGGIKFMDRNIVQDLLAFFRCSFNSRDELAWFRLLLLVPNIGKKKASYFSEKISNGGYDESELYTKAGKKKVFTDDLLKLIEYGNTLKDSKMEFSKIVDDVCDFYMSMRERSIQVAREKAKPNLAGLLDQLDSDKNILPQFKMIANGYSSVQEFFDGVVLGKENESEQTDNLIISTIHSAKGLEYEAVIILDVVDGVIPHSNVEEGSPEDNEERRCFYVAVTRAKKYLYFMMPDVINVYGETVRTEGSRYLRGIV